MDIVHDGPRLVLTGEFDVRSTMEVRTAIHERLRGCDEDLIVDLTGVTAVDVIALRVLAAATVAAEREGPVRMSTQEPPHCVPFRPTHAWTHAPAEQTCPAGQLLPQAPQFCGSVWIFEQYWLGALPQVA